MKILLVIFLIISLSGVLYYHHQLVMTQAELNALQHKMSICTNRVEYLSAQYNRLWKECYGE